MDWLDPTIKYGASAVVGFALGQFVNFTKWAHDRRTRPHLIIEAPDPNCLILEHSTEAGPNGEIYAEEIYGFYVRNVGRRVATEVKFHLLKIECRDAQSADFSLVYEHSYPLAVYNTSDNPCREVQSVIVPGGAVLVGLAAWREDSDAVFPLVSGLPDHYEEGCSRASEYRFTVAAFADRAKSDSKVVLTIRTGRGA